MRAYLFILILFAVAPYLHAADAQGRDWVKGPLVEVLADNTVKEVDEYGGTFVIGHPAFQKLAIRKGKEKDTWIITGAICSTNAGLNIQGAAIYAGYAGGHIGLVAMSDLNGEVLFSLYPLKDSDANPIVPMYIYVTREPIRSPILKGAILRKYLLRFTE